MCVYTLCCGNMDSPTINDGFNIYKRIRNTERNYELPLYSAIRNGNVEHVNMILKIYESDLRFIERSLNCDNKFWLTSAILIGFGDQDISALEALYREYRSVETDQCIDKAKCVVVLLKRDNLTPVNVLCLSPKSEQGKMLTLRMIKSVYVNECLDINAKENKVSLLCATAASGMFDASIRLLYLGADINVLELASFAMAHGQLKYLDSLYTRFGFLMYDIFESNEYFTNIFGRDNWFIFEYVVHAIMEEKQLSWRQIVNYNRVVRDPWTDKEHNSVFHHAVRNNHYGIAEKCLQYSDCQTTTCQCSYLPINELNFCPQSLGLLMKMLEIDPAQLEIMEEHDEEKYHFGVFHYLLSISSHDDVIRIYRKYPAVKNLFFKCPTVGLKFISEMLSDQQYGLMKYVLEISSGLRQNLLYEILERITISGSDNAALFQYVMLMEDFNFAVLSISEINQLFKTALVYRNYQIFQILLNTLECDLNQIQIWHNSNLLKLTFQNNLTANQIFSALLQKQINFYKICDNGKNLLHYSVEANNLFASKKLLELHLDMNKYDKHGKLPIHYATTLELFQLLNTWTTKSYVNVKTMIDACSPLHLCMLVPAGDTTNKLIQYILDNGGNINARNHEMKSPLFLVRDTEPAKLLLALKPNLKIVDKSGNTVINHFLKVNHNHEVLHLLCEDTFLLESIKCQQHVSRNLLQVMNKCRQLTIELLEQPDLDVSVCDGNNNSLLHIAIQGGNLGVIEKLIEKGVSIEHRNYQNETPLLMMCDRLGWVRYSDLMLLLKYNPDVNVKNRNNLSPILLAWRSWHDQVEIIIELLLRGANILDCHYQKTAYDNFSQWQKELFKFLI